MAKVRFSGVPNTHLKLNLSAGRIAYLGQNEDAAQAGLFKPVPCCTQIGLSANSSLLLQRVGLDLMVLSCRREDFD